LHDRQKLYDAVASLYDDVEAHGINREILSALVSFSRVAGDLAAALDYAERARGPSTG
jgi:hypothetical protein